MAEYIDREALLEIIAERNRSSCNGSMTCLQLKRIVEKVPAADAIEVTRCKDCIHTKPYKRADGETGYYCQNNNSTFRYGMNWERLYEPTREASDFCSYGERRGQK